jgi:hypothetical protein
LKVNILKSNQNVFLFYFIEKKWVFNFAIKIVQNFAIKMKTIKEYLDEADFTFGKSNNIKTLEENVYYLYFYFALNNNLSKNIYYTFFIS